MLSGLSTKTSLDVGCGLALEKTSARPVEKVLTDEHPLHPIFVPSLRKRAYGPAAYNKYKYFIISFPRYSQKKDFGHRGQRMMFFLDLAAI